MNTDKLRIKSVINPCDLWLMTVRLDRLVPFDGCCKTLSPGSLTRYDPHTAVACLPAGDCRVDPERTSNHPYSEVLPVPRRVGLRSDISRAFRADSLQGTDRTVPNARSRRSVRQSSFVPRRDRSRPCRCTAQFFSPHRGP